jgi:hypothetical protein
MLSLARSNRFRLGTLFAAGLSALALTASAASAGSIYASSKSCPKFVFKSEDYTLSIAGATNCTTGKSVALAILNGAGAKHINGPLVTWIYQGWTCGKALHSASCSKPNALHAKALISALPQN